MKFVGQVGREELRMNRAAALDHQSLDAAGVQVLADRVHVDGLTAVDDGGHRAEPGSSLVDLRTRAIHHLLDVAGGEEVSVRIELTAPGHGDLHRRRRLSASEPLVLP